MSMQIDGTRNGGYPYDSASIAAPTSRMTAPYPERLWKTYGDYPCIRAVQDVPDATMEQPYPDNLWCVNGIDNDGYPFIWSYFVPTAPGCNQLRYGSAIPQALFYGSTQAHACYYGSTEVYRNS